MNKPKVRKVTPPHASTKVHEKTKKAQRKLDKQKLKETHGI